jgi:hypothetical protein
MSSPVSVVRRERVQADLIQRICWENVCLAYIIRRELSPAETTFITPPDCNPQVGFVVYPAGGEIPPHAHAPLERRIVGTPEVLVLREGRCEIDIFNDERQPVTTVELRKGDVMLMVAGGHAFRMLEDTVFLEVKQGPYAGDSEKERF